VDIKIQSAILIPSTAYLLFKVTGTASEATFADVDPSYLEPNFQNALKYKYIAAAPGPGFVVWGFSADLAAAADYTVQVYAKLAASNSVTAKLYADSALLNSFGTKTSTAVSYTADTGASVFASAATLTSSFKVGTLLTSIGANIKYAAAALVTGDKIIINLTDPGLGCTTAVGTVSAFSLDGGASGAGGLTSVTSGVISAATASGYAVPTSQLAATITLTTGCTPTLAGYASVLLGTQLLSTSVFKEFSIIKVFVSSTASFTTFTLTNLAKNLGWYSTIGGNLKPTTALVAGDALVFGFPMTSSGTSFLPSLGLVDAAGAPLIGGSEVPVAALTALALSCWLQPGYSGYSSPDGSYFHARIICKLGGAFGNGTDEPFYIPKITNPSLAVTPTFTLMSISASSKLPLEYSTKLSTALTGSACIDSNSVTNIVPTISALASGSGTYTLPVSLGAATSTNNDFFWVEFGSAFEISTVSAVTVSNSYWKLSTPSIKGILINSSAPGPSSISFGLTAVTNPPSQGTYNTIKVYGSLVSGLVCTNVNTFGVTISSGTLTDVAISNRNDVGGTIGVYLNEDSYFSVSFKTVSAVPVAGTVEVTFPTTLFEPVQYFNAASSAGGVFSLDSVNNKLIFTVSGSSIPALTTVTFSSLYIPVLFSASVSTSITLSLSTKYNSSLIDSASASITPLSASGKYLRQNLLFLRTPGLYLQPFSDSNGAANVALRLHFKTPASIIAKAECVNITFASNIYLAAGTSALYAYFEDDLVQTPMRAYSVTRGGNVITVYAPSTGALSGSYTLTISANKADIDGLVASAIHQTDIYRHSTTLGY